ncbi:hypothetical protein I4U23_011654 [Adineta vaga]|nr:hypothetical protein I4U23_011654 [Adineta vaga]
MINLLISTFVLCSSVLYYCNASFVAVFLTEDIKNLLKDKFLRSHQRSSPYFGNSAHIYCKHSTIEFNSRSYLTNKYKAHYGDKQKFIILAYAEDEHAQTILVHSVDNNDNHPSLNEYPHVTLSVSGVAPYTPVYSNDLWKRSVDDGIVEVQMDDYDKPRTISMKNQTHEWDGKLRSYEKYEETQVYIKIINELIELNGIVCMDSLWQKDKCKSLHK